MAQSRQDVAQSRHGEAQSGHGEARREHGDARRDHHHDELGQHEEESQEGAVAAVQVAALAADQLVDDAQACTSSGTPTPCQVH